MNYFARGDQVFYFETREDCAMPFLTVHQTPSTLKPEEQAEILADMLNKLPVVKR